MNNLIQVIGYLSFLLLSGVFIRTKIKIFQKLFIPSSVIGGVVGLLLNPYIFPIYKGVINEEWYSILKFLPGILIIPIIISIPLGFNIEKGIKKDSLNMGMILLNITFFQLFLGYLVHFIYVKIFKDKVYATFGAELNAGFAGGHGTAGVIGRTVKDLNVNYWEIAQGVATTLATFGLIFGIIFGIYLINTGCRKGYTEKLKDPGNISESLIRGYEKNIDKQNSLGRETMLVTSVDTLAYHIAIIFLVSGVSILFIDLFKKYKIPIFSKLTVWAFGMFLMYLVWKVMKKMDLQWSIDSKVKSKITGMLTEYAIVSAVATIPVIGIFNYFFIIILVTIFGFLGTWKMIDILTRRYFKRNFYYERGLALFGTSTGVFLTGLLLLRVCDPDLETPVLRDYSLGFSLVALIGPILIGLCIGISFKYGALACVLLMGILLFLGLIGLELFNRKMSS